MSVERYMTRNLVTIDVQERVQTAIALMKEHSVRHLPVVENGIFVGLVTQSDLRGMMIPSMYEEIDVRDVMVTDPIVISPEAPIERAASVIHREKIGALPVVKDQKLVGILTVADIVAAFISMMGVLRESVRLDVMLAGNPGAFEEVSRIIKENGGEIISVGMQAEQDSEKIYSFRLLPRNIQSVIDHMERAGHHVVSTYD